MRTKASNAFQLVDFIVSRMECFFYESVLRRQSGSQCREGALLCTVPWRDACISERDLIILRLDYIVFT